MSSHFRLEYSGRRSEGEGLLSHWRLVHFKNSTVALPTFQCLLENRVIDMDIDMDKANPGHSCSRPC